MWGEPALIREWGPGMRDALTQREQSLRANLCCRTQKKWESRAPNLTVGVDPALWYGGGTHLGTVKARMAGDSSQGDLQKFLTVGFLSYPFPDQAWGLWGH